MTTKYAANVKVYERKVNMFICALRSQGITNISQEAIYYEQHDNPLFITMIFTGLRLTIKANNQTAIVELVPLSRTNWHFQLLLSKYPIPLSPKSRIAARKVRELLNRV